MCAYRSILSVLLQALSAALVEVRAELIEVTQRTVEGKRGRKSHREKEEEEDLRRMLEEKTEELQVPDSTHGACH